MRAAHRIVRPSHLAPRRLVVVSNRLPVSFRHENGELKCVRSSGGLIGALEPILQQDGGVWVGSAGTEDSNQLRDKLRAETHAQGFRYEPVILTPEEQAKYYEGFSNEILWPLFHDMPSQCVFNPEYWDFYSRVNRKFAEVTAAVERDYDSIWVQDYQLMQFARAFRQFRPNAFLSFFLHIPFPSPDIFGKLPWHCQVLQGLLDYDCIGLQTSRDEHNLVSCIRTYLPHAHVAGRLEHCTISSDRGVTSLRALPISIDFHHFSDRAGEPAITERVHELRAQASGLQIALGIDRLDYTKGIPERLRALRVLFRDYPQYRHKLTLIQVVVPSRENISGYQQLRLDIESLVSQINGEFSTPGWTPVRYMHRSVSPEELLGLYRTAGIALVTPLKDGMNLVAKEYCASHIDNDGVLILSEFAGAMPELHAGALAVHPYDEVGICLAIRHALEMDPAERHRRMLRMRRIIRENDVLYWRDRAFEQMDSARSRRQLAA